MGKNIKQNKNMGRNIRGGNFLGGSFPDIVKGIYLRISVKIPQTCVRCS